MLTIYNVTKFDNVCYDMGLMFLLLLMSSWMPPMLRQEVTLSNTKHSFSVSLPLQAVGLSWSEQSAADLWFLCPMPIKLKDYCQHCCHLSIHPSSNYQSRQLYPNTLTEKKSHGCIFVSGSVKKLSPTVGTTQTGCVSSN